MKFKKGASSMAVIVFIIILVIFFTSTKKVEIDGKQIKTATTATCGLLNQDYDPINKIRMPMQQSNNTGG